MERVRTLTLAAGLAAALAAPGCIHVTVDGDGKLKSVAAEFQPAPAGQKPPAGDPAQAGAKTDPQVKQAGATSVPAAGLGLPSIARLTGGPARPGGVSVAATWQNRIAHLPDPTRGGAMGGGLVGQVFLLGDRNQFVPAAGSVTVELFDETPRAGAPASSVKLGQWVLDKDTLNQKLVTTDERFGKCYALFLPWPSYRPEVSRIRLAVRYDPEGSYPVWAPPTTLTIDTSTDGGPAAAQYPPAGGGLPPGVISLMGGPVSMPAPGTGGLPAGGFSVPLPAQPAAPVPGGFGQPIPVGGPVNPAAGFPGGVPGGIPADLPPIVMTAPRGR